ncbi:hypothetical protein SAMN04488102_10624 [Alkalibacterium subtropicum]|uniref:Uncharacterized protein n=1 Tax=Alkalibacterium subtropicum TaxID=753702 RepID=A0A1I1IXP2_9LACT|nr:hypothetical protein [Alkalibacterium subtropicum]SFC39098.1 hypothetical protein SAMN04488102_10624 [Alkalibacterium subtropicum]
MSLKKRFIPVIFSAVTIALAGCSNETLADTTGEEQSVQTAAQEESDSLYRNDDWGLDISPNMDWELESEKESENLHIVLKHNKLKAILSTVSSSQSFEDIKKELIKGSGDVSVLTDSEDYLSYQSKLKKAIRTDVYFKEHSDERNILMIFMSSAENYDANQEKVESLLDHTKLNEVGDVK